VSSPLAIDTSVALPLLLRRHADHGVVARWWAGRTGVLAGHALAETYSVLTRLRGPLRLDAADAASLLSSRFGPPLVLHPETAARLPTTLAERSVWGGAVYDAMVGLTAVEHGHQLATRDARARATYDALGVDVVLVPPS
jgi:toxin FitB